MLDRNCTIGLLNHYEYSELVTIEDLKQHIAENIEFNERIDSYPLLRDAPNLRRKVFTLQDYGDWRKSTNLTRFRFCPDCGEVIDWGSIRKGEVYDV